MSETTVGVFIFDIDDRLLVCHPNEMSDIWGIPKGRPDKGEGDLKKTAIREVMEETFIDLGGHRDNMEYVGTEKYTHKDKILIAGNRKEDVTGRDVVAVGDPKNPKKKARFLSIWGDRVTKIESPDNKKKCDDIMRVDGKKTDDPPGFRFSKTDLLNRDIFPYFREDWRGAKT